MAARTSRIRSRAPALFGTRLNRRMRGKLATVIDQIEHGHHVRRAYFKSAFLKQYEKVSTFLRNDCFADAVVGDVVGRSLGAQDEMVA
jgi:hypothetical protein